MRKSAIRLLALATFSLAFVSAPVITSVYAAPDNDAPPPSSSKGKGKKQKGSSLAPSQTRIAAVEPCPPAPLPPTNETASASRPSTERITPLSSRALR